MKKWVAVMIGVGIAGSILGQTFSEWFRQHKTQIKYLHQQIVALQALTAVIENGYTIIGRGTDTIGRMLQQDEDQHAEHFASLKSVRPSIEKDARIERVRAWRLAIRAHCKACRKASGTGGWLDKREHIVVDSRLDEMEERSGTYIAVLDRLLANSYLMMTNDERLQRLEEIYGEMKRLLYAAIDFRNLVDEIIVYRQRMVKEAEDMSIIYGMENG